MVEGGKHVEGGGGKSGEAALSDTLRDEWGHTEVRIIHFGEGTYQFNTCYLLNATKGNNLVLV